MMTPVLLRLCLVLCLFPVPSAWALAVGDLSAPSGLPGASITLSGSFDTSATHAVSLGGVAAPVTGVTADALSFTVPPLADTGNLVVSENADSLELPLPFVVLREIGGTFTPPAGVAASGYFAGTGEDVRAVGPDGSYTAVVEKGEPATILLFRGEEEPSFLTRISGDDTAAVTDAGSTALAMVLTHPLVRSRDDAFLAQQVAYLSGHAETTTLTERIAALGAADHLDDPLVEDLLVSLVEALRVNVTPPASAAFKSGDDVATYGVRLRELNPDPADTVNPLVRHSKSLNSRVEGIGDEFLNFIYETDRDTRLDWTYSLNELDPFDFPGGIAEIGALDGNDPGTAPRPLGAPLAHGYVRASLDASKLDYFGQAIGAVTSALYDLAVDQGPSNRTDRFVVDRQPAGLYMITATSGNLWYGTDWFFIGTNNQAASIGASDPGYQWELSAGSNAFLAATDALGVILSVKKVGDSYVRAAVLGIAKTISAYRDAGTPLSRAAFLEISKNLVRDLAKTHAKEQAKKAPEKALQFSLQAARAIETARKQIDVLGKIASGLKAIERGATLFSPGTLAMERAVLVVGDPFAPTITAVRPRQGRAGERVVITGSAFGETAPTVTFCEFPESVPPGTEATPIGSPLAATVVETSDTRLVVEVPDGFPDRFTSGKAHLCVEKGADSKADSYPLGEDGIFRFIGTPQVTALSPAPEADGGVITVIGANFVGSRPEARVDGNVVGCSVVADNELLVTLPALNPGPPGSPVVHTLTVAFGDDVSEGFGFTVSQPAHEVDPGLLNGSSLSVDELSMNNVANDTLSVLEALLLANGGLGRNLTFDEQTRVGGYPNVGAGFRDTVNIPGGGQTLVLGQALPALDSGDTIDFNGLTLDGSGLPAGSDGLVVDGVTDLRVIDVVLDGFPGDGIRVTNESRGNEFERITIAGSGENGLFVRNECDFNTFEMIEILDSGVDGLNLADLCDHNEFTDLMIDGAGDDGAELDNGVDRNAFAGLSITDCGGDGLVLTNGALQNRFPGDTEISMVGGTGLVLDGDDVSHNGFYSPLFSSAAAYRLRTAVRDCGEYGVRIENGASSNTLGLRFVSNCELGGVRVAGPTTTGNTIGRIYNRAITQTDELTGPLIYSLVADCGPGSGTAAHGIHLLDSPGTTLTGLNVSGCDGDAIRLSGASCVNNWLLSIRTGVSDFIEDTAPAAAPNAGVGLRLTQGASGNVLASRVPVFIGTFGGGNLSYKHRNRIANDLLGGIVIEEGASANQVLDLDIGGTEAADGEGATGGNGIAILSGAADNRIGGTDYREPVIINACPEAAILVEGEMTTGNVLGGLRIGSIAHRGVDTTFADSRPNARGIEVRNGAGGTRVGVPGPLRNQPSDFFGFLSPYTVRVTGTSGAAVTLDGVDGTAAPAEVSHVTATEVGTGLRVTGGTKGNRIHFNNLTASGTAGIHVDANVIDDPVNERNRFYRNAASSSAMPSDTDLFEADAGAAGLLVSNGSSGNVIGEGISLRNRLQGVIIDGSSGNWIRGNQVNYYGPYNFGNPSSQVLALLLRDSSENLIGGSGNGHGNQFGDPFFVPGGTGGPDSAAVAIDGGMRNTVEGNRIDVAAGSGVFVRNSPSNQIGGGAIPQANSITRCLLHGIRIDGASSQNNHVQGNHIGTDLGGTDLGNSGDGIRIEGAAAANVVGGFTTLAAGSGAFRPVFRPRLPAGNTIAFNGGDGVAVSGAASSGNPITLNSIHSNAGFGIGLPGGGNGGVSLSLTGSHGSGVATGTVTNLGTIPAGSTLHFYGDAGAQGEVFLGQTTVDSGGSWSVDFPLNPLANLSVAATTPDPGGFGNTTPFVPIAPAAAPVLSLGRSDGGTPGSREAAFVSGKLVVHALSATATGSAAQINRLVFQAAGTLDEAAEIDAVSLHLDLDGDGLLDATDPQLGEAASFAADDGTVELVPDSLVAPEGGEVDFLVVYHAATAPPAGRNLSLELASVSAVEANFVMPVAAALPSNPFPVGSDLISLGDGPVGLSFPAWQAAEFPGEADLLVIAEGADPDRDGLINLFEFLFGTDPNDPGSSARPKALAVGESLRFEFPMAKNLEGVAVALESSPDLAGWGPAGDASMSVIPGDPVDTVRYTIPRAGGRRWVRLAVTLP